MRSRLASRIAEIRRQFPLEYLLPIALLLTLSFGCLFALLFHLTDVQDRMQRQRETGLIESAARSILQLADHDLREYAVWDQAVERLVIQFDREWAEDNLGPYLVGKQAYDHVYVLNGAGQALYAHSAGNRPTIPAKMLLGPAFASSLPMVRGERSDPLITGYSRSGNSVYLFAVARVLPLTNKVSLPAGSRHVILVARRVTPAYMGNRVDGANKFNLRMSKDAPGSGAHVPLRSPTGRVVANLHWTPKQPGTSLRNKILPAFLIIGLICFVVSGIIVRRGRRTLEALQFSENRARHLAKHDSLTGLPNRRALRVHLEQLLGKHSNVWLLYMDLDGFKETNDVYGYGAGDGLLKAVGARLRDTVLAEHMLARVGGDEFALAMASDDADAVALAGDILRVFASAFHVGNYRVSLGVSIGLSKCEPSADADELVRRADGAMYAAKSQGKHCFQIYSPSLDAGRELRKQLETDLRSALERDQIGLVYQPIVCARSQKVVCVEALARWLHPTRGLIPPDQFIPIAESSGLIVDLGRAILTKSCSEARAWGVNLAVNLSPAQFWDRGLAATIVEVLNATAFPADRLELEITEGYLMRRPEAAGRILEQLKSLGVQIVLDDFGTGFASIGYLQRLGFDRIKIDRSFIVCSSADKQAAELASAIIAIGAALNLPVTAEGVETEEQAKVMSQAGCSRLQGWHFGKPIPQAEMTEWFASGSRQAS